MGSGEGDAINVYVAPDNFTSTSEPKVRRHQANNLLNQTIGHIGGAADTWWPSSSTYVNSRTIYLYQIKCPKCETMNFMQLETITPCKKCQSRIKATQQIYDYEVPVQP